MFRRVRRILNRSGVPAVPPMLRRANQMLAGGDYANAESAFHDLAQRAEQKFPQHAPMLYIQAGRAAVLNEQAKKGLAHFRSGLTLLGTQARFARLEKIGKIIVDELRARGLTSEANEVEEVIKNNLPSRRSEVLSPSKNLNLPTHCPSCGGVVKPNEVEWLDEITAACDYCGSPIREN
jgi:hypothetical protein